MGRPDGRLVLVVDQFEEVFTLCQNPQERRAFVDNLLTAAAPESGGLTRLVITLRADFYAHCAQFADLRGALEQWQTYIGPMSAEELRRAIEEPAQREGWEFEPGLVELLLREAGDDPGALPLLSHSLLETWHHRRGRMLTLQGYAAAGEMRGAIARTADDVYRKLTPEQQMIARFIFLRLTELGEGAQDTRRRATLAELLSSSDAAATVLEVLKTLTDARLITTDNPHLAAGDRPAAAGEETAEVAHEALIREWPLLRAWLDEDREGLRIQRRLTLMFTVLSVLIGLAGSVAALYSVAKSIQDGLDHYAVQADRAAYDALVRREQDHLLLLRELAFSGADPDTGAPALADALVANDQAGTEKVVDSYYRIGVDRIDFDRVIVFNRNGRSLVD